MAAKTPNYSLNTRGPQSWSLGSDQKGDILWDTDANAQLVDAALAAIQAQIGGGSGIQVASVHVTAAQLLALGSSPVTLVVAQGAKKVVAPVFCVVRYNFVTTGYFVSANSKLILTTPPLNTLTAFLSVNQPGFIDQPSSQETFMTPPASPSPTPIANIENQPLALGDTVGNPSTGDGTLDLAMGYQIVTMP